jgi:flagellar biosynthesis/type III secretory pathway protein FliH
MDRSERPTTPFPSAAVERAAGRVPARNAVAGVGLIVALGLVSGAIGYVVGHSESRDIASERAAGALDGRTKGAAQGNKEGYRPAFNAGRRDGYRANYKRALDAAYKKATAGKP